MNGQINLQTTVGNMGRRPELKEFRKRLWDKFVTVRNLHGLNISFDQFWYEFLARHYILEETPIEYVYEGVCNEMEYSAEPKRA